MLGIDGQLLRRIRTEQLTAIPQLRATWSSAVDRLSFGEHGVQLFKRDTQGVGEFGPTHGCGQVSPRSQRPTVVGSTPTIRASVSWL